MKTRGIIILFFAFVLKNVAFSQSLISLNAKQDSTLSGYEISISVNINNLSVDSFSIYVFNYDSLKNWSESQNINSYEQADFEVSSFGNLKNHNNSFVNNRLQINEDTIRIKIWDEGKFIIIPIENGKKDFLLDKNFPIINILKSINPDEKESFISPINDIIREKKYLSDYFSWFHYLMGLFIFILLGFYLYFKYKRKYQRGVIDILVDQKKQLSPEQIALSKLVSMKQEKIWLLGKTKEYHNLLTQVLKEYFENKYNFNALEMSSTEVLISLKNIIENQRHIEILSEILQISDLVKFAKVDIEINLNEAFLDKSINLINELM